MTQRTFFNIDFPQSGRRKVAAAFVGGDITSDGGALLLRSVDKKLKLSQKLAACIEDKREQCKIRHPFQQILAQRVHAIACGYEDCNDHARLRNDPLFQLLAAEPDKQLASPSTISRFETRIKREELLKMQMVFIEHFFNSHKEPPEEVLLDFDASDIELFGGQEDRHFQGYYGHYCYLPLYVYCGDFLLCAMIRPSNIDGAKHAAPVLKLLHKEIQKRWPSTKVVFRGDGGFCRNLIMSFCEKNGLEYVIGLPKNSRLKKQSKPELDEAIIQYEDQLSQGISRPKGRVIGEFKYQTVTSWKQARRVISRVEYTEKGDNPRYIVTNMKGSPKHLYDKVYCQRGEMENRIKEQQRQMFGDRASCHEMASNQLRLTLSAAAYVLVKELRNGYLQGTELERCEVATIRERLLKIGAQITTSVRRFCVALSSNFPRKDVFILAAKRLGMDSS
jgi:hypothetical protein